QRTAADAHRDVGARPGRDGHPVVAEHRHAQPTHRAHLLDDVGDLLVAAGQSQPDGVQGRGVLDRRHAQTVVGEAFLERADRRLAPRALVGERRRRGARGAQPPGLLLGAVEERDGVVDTALLHQGPQRVGPALDELGQLHRCPRRWAGSVGVGRCLPVACRATTRALRRPAMTSVMRHPCAAPADRSADALGAAVSAGDAGGMNAPVITTTGVRRTYRGSGAPYEAVRGVDLSIGQGELFALLGTNGAGKTSLLEVVEGLAPASAGEVRVFGKDPYADRAAVRARTGIMLQEAGFPADVRAGEMVRMWAATL